MNNFALTPPIFTMTSYYDSAIEKINAFKATRNEAFSIEEVPLSPMEREAIESMRQNHDIGIGNKGIVYPDIFEFLAKGIGSRWMTTQTESVSGHGSTEKMLRTVAHNWSKYLTEQVSTLSDGDMYTILDIAIGDCCLWLLVFRLLKEAVRNRIHLVGLDIAKDFIWVSTKSRSKELQSLMGNRFQFIRADSSNRFRLSWFLRQFTPNICVSRTHLQHMERSKIRGVLRVLTAHKQLFAVSNFQTHESNIDIVDGGCILRKPEMMFEEWEFAPVLVRELEDCVERDERMWMSVYQF